MLEKITHHGSEGTDRDTRFTGDAQIGVTHDHAFRIFFQGIRRTNLDAGSFFAPSAGKAEDSQFPERLESIGIGMIAEDAIYPWFVTSSGDVMVPQFGQID